MAQRCCQSWRAPGHTAQATCHDSMIDFDVFVCCEDAGHPASANSGWQLQNRAWTALSGSFKHARIKQEKHYSRLPFEKKSLILFFLKIWKAYKGFLPSFSVYEGLSEGRKQLAVQESRNFIQKGCQNPWLVKNLANSPNHSNLRCWVKPQQVHHFQAETQISSWCLLNNQIKEMAEEERKLNGLNWWSMFLNSYKLI